MPKQSKFSNFRDDVFVFNSKYKIDFSFEKFEEDVLKLDNIRGFLGKSKHARISNNDKVYRSTYERLYKQAISSVIDKKIAPFDYSALLNDFDNLMEHYRAVCRSANKPAPSKRGAWKKESDVIKAAQRKLAEVNDNKQTDVEERYKKGEIRIRDMRGYANELAGKKETSVEKLSALLNYANALENTNKNRPFWWRAFHLIRNNAEKKYAEEIRNTAKKLLGDDLAEAEALLAQQNAPKLKSDMKELLEKTVAKEEKPAVEKDPSLENEVKEENVIKEDALPKENEVQKEISDELKPVPISVDLDSVKSDSGKSLADMKAKERAEKLHSTMSFKKEMLKEIMSCLVDSPLSENDKRTKAMDQIYDGLMDYATDMICDTYDECVESEESFREIDNTMKEFAKTMFDNAYGALDGFEIPADKKLLAAQKLTNLFLTKATPVGFYSDKFGKYANNFAIKNREVVKYQLENDAEHTINETLLDKIIYDTAKTLNSRERHTVEYIGVDISEPEDSKPYYNTIDFLALDLDDIPDIDEPSAPMRK